MTIYTAMLTSIGYMDYGYHVIWKNLSMPKLLFLVKTKMILKFHLGILLFIKTLRKMEAIVSWVLDWNNESGLWWGCVDWRCWCIFLEGVYILENIGALMHLCGFWEHFGFTFGKLPQTTYLKCHQFLTHFLGAVHEWWTNLLGVVQFVLVRST